jgi:Zyg-11 family protein
MCDNIQSQMYVVVFVGVAVHSPGNPKGGSVESVTVALTDIPGLSARVGRPLEFLGLYGTQHGACHRHDIPAKRVSLNL